MDWFLWLVDMAKAIWSGLPHIFADIGDILWISTPLLAANMLPVVCGRRGHAINIKVLGTNKTWEGLIGGIVGAVLITILAINSIGLMAHNRRLVEIWGQGPWIRFGHILCLAVGTLLGDLLKSFFKRRRGLAPGHSWPLFDQLDAIVGAYALTWLVDLALTRGQWFTANLIPGRWLAIVALLPVYLYIHLLVSIAGHGIGLKKNPH